MKLSFIIVNWNTATLLENCLSSIYAHCDAVTFEVWVVDNASTDNSVAMLRTRFPDVHIIENDANVGFARANNQAMACANGEYFFLLNSDAELRTGAVQALLTHIEANPRCGAVGPKLVNPDGSFQGTFARFPTLWQEFALITTLARWTIGSCRPYLQPKSEYTPESVDWITGAALLLRRGVFDQVGGFDESYFMYSEETDWCWRLRQAGWEIVYVPTATVMHIGGGSSEARSAESYTQLYLSKLQYFYKVHGKLKAELLRGLFIVVALVRIVVWRMLQHARSVAAQRLRQDERLLRRLLAHTQANSLA